MSSRTLIVLAALVTMVVIMSPAYGEGRVKQIKIVADKAPDCSSRKSIVESVTRGCKTNDEKAIAIYNFCKMAWYHRAYPREKGGVAALKMINVYGWSLCGGQHSALSSLWVTAGWKHRFIGWKGHTTVEVNYDDKWHYYDTFLKFYCWKKDPTAPGGRTVASQNDIKSNPDLVSKGLVYDKGRRVYYFPGNQFEVIDGKANWTAPAMLNCGDTPKGVVGGCKKQSRRGSPTGWAGIIHDEKGYNTDINLGPGMSLEVMWKELPDCWFWQGQKKQPYHTCTDKDFRNCPVIGPVKEPYIGVYEPRGRRSYANGIFLFTPDLSKDAFLSGLIARDNVKVADGKLVPADAEKPATITVPLQLPYVFVRASAEAAGVDKAELSVDGGKTFKPVDLKDFSSSVKGKYNCQLKLTVNKELTSLKMKAIVQHNRCSQPYLSPGKNKITVSVADAKQLGENKLCVTYAYSLGSRRYTHEQMAAAGMEIAKGHKASWSDKPTVVQKTFSGSDLPATFEIDVPTPKDKTPVYPRMLFLRREVLASGQKPIALPEGALEAKVGPDEELKTLPNPFLMGTQKPPEKKPRPMKVSKLVMQCSHVVDNEGKSYENHFIKTKPKKLDIYWAMLVGGELKDLPDPKTIAEARLCFPVVNSHAKANVKVGAYPLKVAFEKDKPYDGKNFGGILGSTVVPKQAKAGEPKYHKIDVTPHIKAVAKGDAKFNGLAIKVVPDRGVDDGWTVRIDITKEAETYLELAVYTDMDKEKKAE